MFKHNAPCKNNHYDTKNDSFNYPFSLSKKMYFQIQHLSWSKEFWIIFV